MKLKNIFFVLISFWFISCASLQQDIEYSHSLKGDTSQKLNQIEVSLLDEYVNCNPGRLQIVKHDLEDLLNQPSTDSYYLARVNALYADSFLLERETNKAKKYVHLALKYNSNDEYALLVYSRCIKNQNKKIKYLKNLIKMYPKYYRLKTELGATYFMLNKYSLCVAEFDGALPFLGSSYNNLYRSKRNLAYSQYQIGGDANSSSENVLYQSPLSMIGMTMLAQDNTDVFNAITGNSKWKASILADRLKNAGWYSKKTNIYKDTVTRKDAALFLWHFLVGSDSHRLNSYSTRYGNKSKSPIVDVDINSEYFDAVLGVIEEDIMPLVSGIRFEPNEEVSGYSFYEWLKKADEMR